MYMSIISELLNKCKRDIWIIRSLFENGKILLLLFGCIILGDMALSCQCLNRSLLQKRNIYEAVQADGASEQAELFQAEAELLYEAADPEEEELYDILDEISAHISNCLDYQENVTYVIENCHGGFQLFLSGNKGYLKNRADLVERLYTNLIGIEPVACFSESILLLTDNRLLDAFFCIILIYLCGVMAVREKERKNIGYITPSFYGGRKGCLIRLRILCGLVMLAYVFCYGAFFLILGIRLGMPDFSAAVQCLDGFENCPWRLDIGQYLGIYLIGKGLLFEEIAVTAYAIAGVCPDTTSFLMLVTAFYSGHGLLSLINNQKQIVRTFTEISVFRRIGMNDCFMQLDTYKFGDFAIPKLLYDSLISICGIGIGILLITLVFGHEWNPDWMKGLSRRLEKLVFQKKNRIKGNFRRNEAVKILIETKAVYFLVIFICIQAAFPFYSFSMDRVEYFYKSYALQLQGPLSLEKEEWLASERTGLEAEMQELQNAWAQYQSGEIDELTYQYKDRRLQTCEISEYALQKAENQYLLLADLNASGTTVEFLYLTPYEKLLGKSALTWLALLMLGSLILMTGFLLLFTRMEKDAGTNVILSLTVISDKSRKVADAIFFNILGLVCLITGAMPRLWLFCEDFGNLFSYLTCAPAASLTGILPQSAFGSIRGFVLVFLLAVVALYLLYINLLFAFCWKLTKEKS